MRTSSSVTSSSLSVDVLMTSFTVDDHAASVVSLCGHSVVSLCHRHLIEALLGVRCLCMVTDFVPSILLPQYCPIIIIIILFISGN